MNPSYRMKAQLGNSRIKKIDSYLIVNYKIQKRLTVSAKNQLIEICRKPAPPVGFPYTLFLL